MGQVAFLLNMSILGIKNIEKEIKIDFYGKQVNKSFDSEQNKIKVIYGENGAGKTAIVTAVDIVKEFVLDDNYLRNPKNQLLLAELINKQSKRFVFKCEFATFVDSLYIFEYQVCLSFDENGEVCVDFESLKYKKNNSRNVQTTAFVCEKGVLTELNVDKSERDGFIEKTKNLLSKQSAIFSIFRSIAQNQNAFKERMLFVYPVVFFLLLSTYFDREDRHITYYQKLRINELRRSQLPGDTVIEEIVQSIPANERKIPIKEYEKYKSKILGLERFIKLFKPTLSKIDIDERVDGEFYICRIIMNYGNYTVDREFESAGIKHLIDMYDALRSASNGSIVFIDEMDANINDVMLRKLIEYFKFYGEGQLCITSHNTEPMLVLKDNNKAIDFLTSDNRLVPWIKNGHYSPESCYRNGMIDGLPFNIDSSDFIAVFGEVK